MFFKAIDTLFSVFRNFLIANALLFVVAPVTHQMIRNILHDNYVCLNEKVSSLVKFFSENVNIGFNEKDNVIEVVTEKVYYYVSILSDNFMSCYGYDIAYNCVYAYSVVEHKSKKVYHFYVTLFKNKYETLSHCVKVLLDKFTILTHFVRCVFFDSFYDEIDFENIYSGMKNNGNNMNDMNNINTESDKHIYTYNDPFNYSTIEFVKDGRATLTLPLNIFLLNLSQKDTDNRMVDREYDFVIYNDYEHPNKDGSINKVILHEITNSLTKDILNDYVVSDCKIIMMECEFNNTFKLVELKTNEYNYLVIGNILSDAFVYYFLRKHYGYKYNVYGNNDKTVEDSEKNMMNMNMIDSDANSFSNMKYDFSKLFSNNPSILVSEKNVTFVDK